MAFRDDYAAAAEHLESYFSREIEYIDPNYADAVEVLATVHKDRRERRLMPDGSTHWLTVRDVFLFDHTDPTIAAPRQDATITIDGENYAVVAIGKPSEGRTRITLRRNEKQEIARKGYRSR